MFKAQPHQHSDETVAVIGMGYVGRPLADALAPHHAMVIGYDIDADRIMALQSEATGPSPRYTADPAALAPATVYVLALPTPLDPHRRPDLSAVQGAATAVGAALCPGDLVVLESTVYPGTTEGVVGPLLEAASGLTAGADFQLAYSPERINPGDPDRDLGDVVKVIAASDSETLARVERLYGAAVPAGLYQAASIQAAEMAKLVENTQRDLNIALMNEVAVICDRLGLRTRDVLDAAATKWNFLPFEPGLVGGHCISVDPYYLTAKAQAAGYHPEVILAGRRINDAMGSFIARKTAKLLAQQVGRIAGARVAVLGLTFKANWPDLRNSRVIDLVSELRALGCEVLVHDPMVTATQAWDHARITLVDEAGLTDLDAIVLAVRHRDLVEEVAPRLVDALAPGRVVIDVKSALPELARRDLCVWSL